jgi:(p)ppGpp synthase/HD superfamily hydrolase
MKERAKQFAEQAHHGQVRKAGNVPYITHPIRVAERLEQTGASDELVSAAYLHDVVEDTPVEIEEIEQEFGHRVAELVRSHTEDKSKTWKERKQKTIDTLAAADDEVVKLIIADRLDNLLSLEKDLKTMGEDVWGIFNAGYEDQKWYNTEMLKQIKKRASSQDPDFFPEFEATVERIFK